MTYVMDSVCTQYSHYLPIPGRPSYSFSADITVIAPTPTPTPTPTPIPPPQGEWSQYWNINHIHDLVIDGEGYLWGQGSGTIIRWNTREGTYQEFGTAQGLPANTADRIFLGPDGEVWLHFHDNGLWQFDDPYSPHLIQVFLVELQ